MATTHFLLQSNFNSNSLFHKSFHLPSLSQSLPTKWPCPHNIMLRKNYSSEKAIGVLPKFRIRCFIMDHKLQGKKGFGGNRGEEDHGLKKVVNVRLALAASSRRMCRSSFSSRTRSSSSRSSSYSSSPESSSSSSSETDMTQTSSPTSSSETYTVYKTQSSSPVHTKSWKEVRPLRIVVPLVIYFLVSRWNPPEVVCLVILVLLEMWKLSDTDQINTVKTSVNNTVEPSVLELQVFCFSKITMVLLQKLNYAAAGGVMDLTKGR